MEARGLRLVSLRALDERLTRDFAVASRGYALFADTADERERAVRSDELHRAVQAVATNLMEARLEESDLVETVGDDGLAPAIAGSGSADYLALTNTDRHLTGFFRAFGSVLDTLAAVAIGVLRVPRDISRVSYIDLLDLDDLSVSGVPTAQRCLWQAVSERIRRFQASDPAGWFDFAIAYRNAVVHRGRQLSIFFPVDRPALRGIDLTETHDPIGTVLTTTRFVPHLRQRPWKRDLDDLIESHTIGDVWIAETAVITVSGLRESLNDLVEDIAQTLLGVWDAASRGGLELIDLPIRRRQRAAAPEPSTFLGYSAGVHRTAVGLIVGTGHETVRTTLANELRTPPA